jgi:hypothetical protein
MEKQSMKLTINANALRAAAIVAAKKDVRFYLCGVHVWFDVGTMHAQATGTDGQVLVTGRVPFEFESGAQSAPWGMIIPTSAIPKKGDTATLEALPDGRYMLNDTVFAPVDGKFPDYARVIPTASQFCEHPAAPGQYDANLLVKAQNALHTFYGTSKGGFYLHQRGPAQSAIMAGHDSFACAIVMPWRVSDDVNHVPCYELNRDSFAVV